MELEGEIEDIIYQNEINSYTIARLETADEEITIVGYLPFVSKGDTIKVTGNYVEHKEYGEQFKVITFEKLMPRTASAIQKYLANANIKGIGEKVAARIVERFGEKTINIINHNPLRLAEVKGISEEKAKTISDPIKPFAPVISIVLFL